MIKGVYLEGNKNISITNDVIDICNPKIVYVPLVNYSNMNCKCIVKTGKKVKKGTIIGIREDLDFPILSPISGTVIDINKCLYLNREIVNCVVIENNGKEENIKNIEVKDITSYTKEEFINILKDCAVTGMSGTDFPTFIKYKTDLNTLIINAVECEPYITSDLMLVKLKAKEIIEGINAIMIINKINKCFIAVKENNDIIINNLKKYIKDYPNIYIKRVKNVYPIGWEKYIIKSILKKDYIKLPTEIGVVVNNVSTIYAIYKALKYQRSISKRIVTITGERFNEPVNVLVKIGTRIKDIIKNLGGYNITNNMKLVAGGPMMGFSLLTDDVVVTKNLNCILVIDDINEYDDITCMRCGKCDNICPVNISPIYIKENLNDKKSLLTLEPKKCIECGLCSYICPSKIDLRTAVKAAKKEVEK